MIKLTKDRHLGGQAVEAGFAECQMEIGDKICKFPS